MRRVTFFASRHGSSRGIPPNTVVECRLRRVLVKCMDWIFLNEYALIWLVYGNINNKEAARVEKSVVALVQRCRWR